MEHAHIRHNMRYSDRFDWKYTLEDLNLKPDLYELRPMMEELLHQIGIEPLLKTENGQPFNQFYRQIVNIVGMCRIGGMDDYIYSEREFLMDLYDALYALHNGITSFISLARIQGEQTNVMFPAVRPLLNECMCLCDDNLRIRVNTYQNPVLCEVDDECGGCNPTHSHL